MDNTQPDVEAVRARVRALRSAGMRRLAEVSGVKIWNVKKFAYKEVTFPRADHWEGIKKWLSKVEAQR